MDLNTFLSYILDPASRLTASPEPATEEASGNGLGFVLLGSSYGDESSDLGFQPLGADDADIATAEPAEEVADLWFGRYLLTKLFGDCREAQPLGGSGALFAAIQPAGLAALLPKKVAYWDRKSLSDGSAKRVVLIEFGQRIAEPEPGMPSHEFRVLPPLTGTELLRDAGRIFAEIGRQGRLEDALERISSAVLEAMRVNPASAHTLLQPMPPHDVLCVISIRDDREEGAPALLSFATHDKETNGLETFYLREESCRWDDFHARQYLTALYTRCFAGLAGPDWHLAFTRSDERDFAAALQKTCTETPDDTEKVHDSLKALINLLAKSYGHAVDPSLGNPLDAKAFDHDIGVDPKHPALVNPIPAVTLRDSNQRLLGYILYALKDKAAAATLRESLRKHNRFHNVLVVYPASTGTDGVAEVNVELWQGNLPLVGKLRKGQGHKGAAEIVNLLSRFFVVSRAKVKDPEELAKELAFRARYLRRVAVDQLETEPNGTLHQLFAAFKTKLVQGQKPEEFADAFAQTLTYSLLTARWIAATEKDGVAERFTRTTAKKHLTHGSHFLSEMFNAALASPMAGQQTRLDWLIDDVADLLDRLDIKRVFRDEVEESAPQRKKDQIIHFYEPFLKEYDPEIKRQRGVFYTPWQVVSYIVRSVHEVLQTEFGLEDGLADVATWGEMAARIEGLKIPAPCGEGDRFVTILDPATGTGTFLVECVEVICSTMKAKWRGLGWGEAEVAEAWNAYVPKHLIPRLHGFELLVAPYAVAHLKLRMKLAETGYLAGFGERLHVYLTNSLEPQGAAGNPKIANLFMTLALEAQAVNTVKAQKHFTVVIGNPPYSVSSWNTGTWITGLTEDYKRTVRAEESQIQSLSNDYIKFLRLGQWLVERAGVGLLGMITGHGYLQGTQPRDMRQHLSRTFDYTHCLDLHGSIRRAGTDDLDDEPVFQIMTGVAIIVGIRKTPHKPIGRTSLGSLTGNLRKKFRRLADSSAGGAADQAGPHTPVPPYYLFAPSATAQNVEEEYFACPDLPAIFGTGDRQKDKEVHWATGFSSRQDSLAVAFTELELSQSLTRLATSDSMASLQKECPVCTTKHWDYESAKRFVNSGEWRKHVVLAAYRPFDLRWIVAHKLLVTELREQVMSQLVRPGIDNIGLVTSRAVNDLVFAHTFVTEGPVDKIFISSKTSTNAYVFPLYFSNNDMYGGHRRANFSRVYARGLAKRLGARVDPESGLPIGLAGVDIFHYIYAILNSPDFRERYGEFLKQDFPRIPQTSNMNLFRSLAKLGGELIEYHLLRSIDGHSGSAACIGGADPEVDKIGFDKGGIWLNKAQTTGFHPVPENVWNFHIGGYQVCEKWLKDRKGRTLTPDDITHYQKIITAITETIRIMTEIDAVIEAHGGWPAAFLTTGTPGTTAPATDTAAGGGDN